METSTSKEQTWREAGHSVGNSEHSGLGVSIVGMAADGSSKEEVPDGQGGRAENESQLSEVEWKDELRRLGGGEAMDK